VIPSRHLQFHNAVISLHYVLRPRDVTAIAVTNVALQYGENESMNFKQILCLLADTES